VEEGLASIDGRRRDAAVTRAGIPGDFTQRLDRFLEGQRDWVVEELSRCIAIPSISGSEREAIVLFKGILATLSGETLEMPVPVEIVSDEDYSSISSGQPYSARPNLVHVRNGALGGRDLIVSGHADVVPAPSPEAFAPRLAGDALFGRGACDDKGPVFAWLLALKALDHFGVRLKGRLETHIVVEEEVGGNGALSLVLGGRRADGVIVLEPSELHIHPAGRGALWFKIEIEGRSTHMAAIHEGVSAVKEGIKVIQALESYEKCLLGDSRDNPLFSRYPQPVMVNIGRFDGGDWPSTLPASATIEGGVGFLPNRTLEQVRREIRASILEGTGKWVKEHHCISFDRLHNEAYQIDSGHALVKAMQSACTSSGMDSEVHGMAASCDARLYYHRGSMPAVVFGPGSLKDAHSREDRVQISDVIRAAKALVYMTYYWCGWTEASS
jgi:acetylornithine deacetylase